jgi:alpha-N-acetylglucosamine transferase
MQGVIILSLKNKSYPMGAYNLALSIKHYNPSISITLVTDNEHQKHYRPEHYLVFDSIKTIARHHYINDGMFQPALAKLNIYKYSSYDKTLYIDADSLVLQDIQPLFNKLLGNGFKGNVLDNYVQWTDAETFKEFFGVEQGLMINSSWFYFENNEVFEQANDYYNKGFNSEKIEPKWGLSLPDELFFNASLIKLGVNPKVDFEPMFFGNLIDQRTLSELQNDFFMFTLYGGRHTVRSVYVDFYDRICHVMNKAIGFEHLFKARDILTNKHVNNK